MTTVSGKRGICLGCIADDFTGASDAASFLVRGGMETVLYNGVPSEDALPGDGIRGAVIALKTRTMETAAAVEESLRAARWLLSRGAGQLYFKYCSTFDSTRRGNIGPVTDALLELLGAGHTVLCPALPVNGRVVRGGRLYVDGVPLDESHMKNHPLTPMWASDIAELMEPQGKYPCLKLDCEAMSQPVGRIRELAADFGRGLEHFYIVPDYVNDGDAARIVGAFGDLPLLTGGSGLMLELARRRCAALSPSLTASPSPGAEGRALLLAGSCSKATLSQIARYKRAGGAALRLDPAGLLSGAQSAQSLWDAVLAQGDRPVLAYSSDDAEGVRRAQARDGGVSALLEDVAAELARRAVAAGYTRIIVAGGETSGAVTRALGFDAYQISESVAPGVPVMIPLRDRRVRLVLKSGNFGQEDFFRRALDMTAARPDAAPAGSEAE